MQALTQLRPAHSVMEELGLWAGRFALRPLQALMAAPTFLFLAALAAMLLRHPDVDFYAIDRIVFGLLIVAVVGSRLIQRGELFRSYRATWPMVGLTLMALTSVAGQPFDHETWSLLAAKFIVPFTLFHLAGLVFTGERQFRQFEMFAVIVLAYLSFTAIAFLIGAHSLIFPRFILDESLGHHANRARGPLLQAVANGVSLNMLGVLALHAYRRKSIRGVKMILLLGSVPLAILATMTRTVWLAFAGTVLALIVLSRRRFSLWLCAGACAAGMFGLVLVGSATELGDTLSDRLQESGPVEYREAVYAGSWEMFRQHPIVGWGFHQMPAELPRHVERYQEKDLYPHNTYLELLVEHGILGLALYFWLMWELWRVGRGKIPPDEQHGLLDANFHRLWMIVLAVYWLNAAAVVMSYQFVNGLLFSLAGMLAAQNRRAEVSVAC